MELTNQIDNRYQSNYNYPTQMSQQQTPGLGLGAQLSDFKDFDDQYELDKEQQTFVFSDLPPEEKDRFMEFLLANNVDFSFDPQDSTYVATVKLVNEDGQGNFMGNNNNQGDGRGFGGEINGLEQLKQFDSLRQPGRNKVTGGTSEL